MLPQTGGQEAQDRAGHVDARRVNKHAKPLVDTVLLVENPSTRGFTTLSAQPTCSCHKLERAPCLVPVVAADCEAERPWLATPYIPGSTLQQHIAAHGPLQGAVLLALAAGAASDLASVHAARVIHRDIKPGNVILSPSGPRLLDFGIAHAFDGTSVTRTGMLTGTPGWISPEQYRTGSVGPESDVFAWGALVAYAGTGRHPFGTGAPDTELFQSGH
ncbi:protein kinase [Streptomyces sp. NPDC007818]|uniref:protein kinase domain-containing protein n=1 Tax=Streptomyces sp. NPDC007818 TaxID=3364780 RepID=UPI0036A3D230